MSKFVYGIVGHAKAGKDTFTDAFFHELSLWPRMHFHEKLAVADGIRKVAYSIGFTYDQVHVQELKEVKDPVLGISARDAMQGIGKMFRDTFNEKFWINRLFKEIDGLPDGAIIFVTDIRMPIEAKSLRERYKARLIKVKRPSLDLSLPMYQHDTELSVDKIRCNRVMVNSDKCVGDFVHHSREFAREEIKTYLEPFMDAQQAK